MKNLITRTMIDNALKFYSILDNEYKMKCYKCVDEIQENKDYQEKVNDIYNLLYRDKNDRIRELWNIKNISELFGDYSNSFITNVLLLSGHDIHKDNMKKYALDEKQVIIHKHRVREALVNDIKIRGYDGIRISQMLWGVYFINIRIIEVGRLQYEFVKFNPLNEEESKKCIKIHIPNGKKLLDQEVKESIIKSKSEILKYFGLENPDYYCSSWLLSPSINRILDKNSNIVKFYNMFNVIKEKDGLDDILDFVFNVTECNDYKELKASTSLQIKLKEMLIKKEEITKGVGILKKLSEENKHKMTCFDMKQAVELLGNEWNLGKRESCDYSFYEKCGCKKVYETIVKNREYGILGDIQIDKAYIYEKKLRRMK